MNYFRINLNKLEDKSEIIRLWNRQGFGLLFLSLLFIGVTILVGKTYHQLGLKKSDFQKTIVTLEAQIKELEQGENYIGETEVMDLYDLTNTRIFWTEKLEALASVVDTSIALTSVTFHRDKLYLRGITEAPDEGSRFLTISTFIDSIKAAPVFSDFQKISFSSSDRITYMDRNLINFEVVCLQNRD